MDVEQRSIMNADGTFDVSLYKVFLFIHIASALKSGMLNLKHSHKYRPLSHYMISKERWAKDRENLIEKPELQKFACPTALLKKLDDELYQQCKKTNRLYLGG